MSDAFNQVLLRLKAAVGLQNNKDVAALLGMQEKAFTARKARGSFPETELYALAAKRPDLDVDVEYVLTGKQALPGRTMWLRLQAQLGYEDEASLFAWLGMPFGEAQDFLNRGAFPVQQFLAACEKHPDDVDPDYVLTSVGMAARSIIGNMQRGMAAGVNLATEQAIVDLYRSNLLFRQAADALFALATKPEKTP